MTARRTFQSCRNVGVRRIIRFAVSRNCPEKLERFHMPHETRPARPRLTGVGDVPSVRAVQKGLFSKEGEYWTVGYGRNSVRLKDSRGLGCLAHLLRHPGVQFHVLDLAGGIAGRRDDDETGQSAQGLPRGDDDLKKA